GTHNAWRRSFASGGADNGFGKFHAEPIRRNRQRARAERHHQKRRQSRRGREFAHLERPGQYDRSRNGAEGLRVEWALEFKPGGTREQSPTVGGRGLRRKRRKREPFLHSAVEWEPELHAAIAFVLDAHVSESHI